MEYEINRKDSMSIGQQPKILGIVPSYLTMMVNGKRPWKPEIKARDDQFVNSLPKSVHKTSKNKSVGMGGDTRLLGVKHNGEPGGIRTHDTRIKSPMLCQLSYRPILFR